MKSVRGYIFSRPFFDERVPQHVQNMVIREYCAQNSLNYLLSATEYAKPGCHLILDQTLSELPRLSGIVAYSLFQMPINDLARARVFDTVVSFQKTLHFAVEGLQIENRADVERIETIIKVRQVVSENYVEKDVLFPIKT